MHVLLALFSAQLFSRFVRSFVHERNRISAAHISIHNAQNDAILYIWIEISFCLTCVKRVKKINAKIKGCKDVQRDLFKNAAVSFLLNKWYALQYMHKRIYGISTATVAVCCQDIPPCHYAIQAKLFARPSKNDCLQVEKNSCRICRIWSFRDSFFLRDNCSRSDSTWIGKLSSLKNTSLNFVLKNLAKSGSVFAYLLNCANGQALYQCTIAVFRKLKY